MDQSGESVSLSVIDNSGCQISTIKTRRADEPLCQTSCSKLSSNINSFPSSQLLKNPQNNKFTTTME